MDINRVFHRELSGFISHPVTLIKICTVLKRQIKPQLSYTTTVSYDSERFMRLLLKFRGFCPCLKVRHRTE